MIARAAAGAACEVSSVEGLEGFDRLRPEWDRLCAAMGEAAQPFWSPGWIRAYVAAFERPAGLRVFVARRRGELVAALPLLRERGWLRGLPVRRLRSPVGNFSVRFDLPALPGPAGEAGVRAIAEVLASDRKWDVLELRDVPEGGVADGLLRELAAHGHPIGHWPSYRSPYIDLNPGAAAGAPRPLSRNLREQLGKSRRRLEAAGPPLCLERLRWNSQPELCAHLQRFYEIENAGWKGDNGSSILARPGARRFLDEAAIAMAAQDMLVLYQLGVGDRTLAMAYCVRQGSGFYACKWAYDEEFAQYSPGHLLIAFMLQDILAEPQTPIRRFDFTGENDPYKQKWAAAQRPHAYGFAFRRGWRGRGLFRLKFALPPRRRKRQGRP